MAPKAQSLLEERAVKGGYRTGGASLSIADREQANAALEAGDRESEDRGEVDLGESSGPSKASDGQGQTMTRVRSTVEFDANDFVELPLVEKLPFNVFVAVVTLLNILVLGLEQDMGGGSSDLAGRMSWYILECLFSICFVVEMILRISHALSCKRDWLSGLGDWLSDIWNFLDLLLVIASVIDAFALVPLGVGGQVRLFTVLRALRVVRLVRLVRTLSYFRELWLLVGGLVNSMKALGWVVLIALTVLYVCSIVVTTEIGQNHAVYGVGPSYDGELWPYESYFGDVRKSMFSLFQVMTMDGWCDDIVRHVVHRQPWMGLFFVIFLFLTAFGLVNVVIGIIVENTLAAAQVASRKAEEDEARARRRAVEQLTDLLVRSDSRRTGEISIAELQVAHESAIVQDLFKKIGLTMEEARNIFALLDYERRGRVELKRFANSCRELVGGAKRRDIAQVEITVGTLARHLEQLDGQFSKIEAEVVNLTKMADDFVQHTVRTLTGFNGNHKQHLQTHGSLGGHA